MNSGSVNGALGLSDRTDVIHTSRSGAPNGSARTSTVSTTEKTAAVAPIASASVHTTVAPNAGWRRYWRSAIRTSVSTAFMGTELFRIEVFGKLRILLEIHTHHSEGGHIDLRH